MGSCPDTDIDPLFVSPLLGINLPKIHHKLRGLLTEEWTLLGLVNVYRQSWKHKGPWLMLKEKNRKQSHVI